MAAFVLESMRDADGTPVGALVRRVEPTSLATLVCFRTADGGLYRTHNRIELDDASPFHWRHFVHHDESVFIEREHQADDPEALVPSFAEHLLVARLLASGETELAFVRLDEFTATQQPASLVRDGDRVYLRVDGRPTTTWTLHGDVPTSTDWGGLTSHVVDEQVLLGELTEPVAGHVRDFLGQ